jgi:hypothetical protein
MTPEAIQHLHEMRDLAARLGAITGGPPVDVIRMTPAQRVSAIALGADLAELVTQFDPEWKSTEWMSAAWPEGGTG